MDLREQSIIGFFSEFVFQFSVAQILVGLRKQLKKMFFSLSPVLLVLIIIKICGYFYSI